MVDVSKFSEREISRLIADARKQMKLIDAAKTARIRSTIEAMVTAEGFTLHDVFPELGEGECSRLAPKYRDPNDASKTWDGAGKAPDWFLALIRLGWSKQRLLIARQDAQEAERAASAPSPKSHQKCPGDANTSGLFRSIGIRAGARIEGAPDARYFPKSKPTQKRRKFRYMP